MSRAEAIDCLLETSTRVGHAEQVYTGLALLHAEGRIRLRQRVIRTDRYDTTVPQIPVGRRDMVHPGFVRVVLEGGKHLHFDLADGPGIDLEALDRCDLYFKRSFLPATVESLGERGKRIRPFGLNFEVFPNFPDRYQIERVWRLTEWKEMPRELVRCFDIYGRFTSHPRLRQFGAPPDPNRRARALFLARTWDPHDDPERPPEKVAEFQRINDTRAECIRLLRKEFGERFLGGFAHTAHACKHYPDVLAPETTLTAKRRYLALLREFPVCVATTGLHGSIGWKLAEYVSLSKAIVSESLNYEVPGGFGPGHHYQEFSGAEGCVEAVSDLFSDDGRRRRMMENNYAYYLDVLRPDRLVWRALMQAT